VIPLSLAELAAAVDGRLAGDASPDATVTAVVIDSRQAQPGSLFVALSGSRADGATFAADACRRGAVAALVSRDVGAPAIVVPDPLAALGRLASVVLRRLPDVRVVGITGSNGKTTTKDLAAELLGRLGPTVAAPASYNGEIGLPLSVLGADATTRHLVLEYGARGLDHIRELASIARPDIAIVLGVGIAHMGEFGSRDAIAAAKGELVEALNTGGVAILNADDAFVGAMRARTTSRVVTFGRDAGADVRATGIGVDALGRARFTLVTAAGQAPVQLRLYGEHQVTNALAAAAAALELGSTVESTAAALSAAAPSSRWRMEVTETPDGVTVINDAYNANPDSMAAGLRALVAMAAGRRTWAVLGNMAELGDIAHDAHRDVGRLAAELHVDRLVVVGPSAELIATGASGSAAATVVDVVPDVSGALALLRADIAVGDVILVKASRSAGLEQVAEALTAGVVPA
jgi:UDP-N-acetylmuramoyl-tripeptide--D-alanyl-D-alanine ligase